MSFTNTSPLVYPTRAKERTFGTNPLSVAAPGKDGDSFVLDMATSSVAFGKVSARWADDQQFFLIRLGSVTCFVLSC